MFSNTETQFSHKKILEKMLRIGRKGEKQSNGAWKSQYGDRGIQKTSHSARNGARISQGHQRLSWAKPCRFNLKKIF